MTETEKYESLFRTEFSASIHHKPYCIVVPIPFPDLTGEKHFEFAAESEVNTDDRFSTAIHQTADLLQLEDLTDDEITSKTRLLVQRAVGAYHSLCYLAEKRHGCGCGVSHKIEFFIEEEREDISRPEQIRHTWVGFRMKFFSVPVKWVDAISG
jgi:hypothetical protein